MTVQDIEGDLAWLTKQEKDTGAIPVKFGFTNFKPCQTGQETALAYVSQSWVVSVSIQELSCGAQGQHRESPSYSWTHSLHYNLTVRSQGGSVQSRSFANGYWDHQLFLHFDNDKKESAKPQGPWAEKPLGTESWDTEIQELAEHSKNLKATLADINAWQEQKGGSHFLQETWGCKIHKDNRTRAFWNFYYDGEPFLSYHPETRSWTVEPSSAQNLAMEVKNSWDADGMQSKDYWAQVQGELCGRLRRYLVFWKGSSYSPGASAQRTLCEFIVL
uniref:MHC class I polypeptide-related sequence B-like n=1 Tax=Urocitellus parryii TaxID=9999 RepID=UPI000E5610B3|nr:MHC class I polypeptide-related sequence B-like [Urocitellus parryii]